MELWTGWSVGLSGTTAADRPELAGDVLEDELRRFSFSDPASGAELAEGELQDRVVRSEADGTLDFYFRITEFSPSRSDLSLIYVGRGPFWRPPVDVDYRVDGLGDQGPIASGWPGTDIQFHFWAPASVTQDALSRFTFIKTRATDYVPDGFIALGLHDRSGAYPGGPFAVIPGFRSATG